MPIFDAIWKLWQRQAKPGFKFVYVNQDGSVREVSPAERAYLSEEFTPADGGQPYIKSRYKSRDGWGSQSGFILRRRVPAKIQILPVHPDFDERCKELQQISPTPYHMPDDIVTANPDGSVTCTPNPAISAGERFEVMKKNRLEAQRHREMLAKGR